MSVEQVDVTSTLLHPRRPLLAVRGARGQWAHPNVAGPRAMLRTAGFDVEAQATFSEPFGPAHPWHDRFGAPGVPTSAVRCRPAV